MTTTMLGTCHAPTATELVRHLTSKPKDHDTRQVDDRPAGRPRTTGSRTSVRSFAGSGRHFGFVAGVWGCDRAHPASGNPATGARWRGAGLHRPALVDVAGGTDLPAVVLLHGSGQDEHTLLAFAQVACAGHTLTAVRGRIPWEGGFAFFRRRVDRSLDQAGLAQGAAAVQRLLVHVQGRRTPAADPARLLEWSDRCGGCHPRRPAAISGRDFAAPTLAPSRTSLPAPRQLPDPAREWRGRLTTRPSDGPSHNSQFRAAGAASTLVMLPVGHGLTAADQAAVTGWRQDLDDQPASSGTRHEPTTN